MNKRKSEAPPGNVLYGVHPVLETIRSRRRVIERVYRSKSRSLPPEFADALHGLPVTQVSPDELVELTGSMHHQGLAAKVGPFPYASLDDIVSSRSRPSGLVILLDEIQDPGNVGSIIRSAECLGAAGMVLTKDRAAPITPAVEKAAAGAAAHLPLARVVNLVRAIEELKAARYWVYGADVRARQVYTELDWTGEVALVLGSEGKGLRRLVLESCDARVTIPMAGKIASLNVAQTATIVLGEAQRQRRAKVTSGHAPPH